MKTHRHRAKTTITRCFSGPVSGRQNPAAHGNVCRIDTCSCGATRATNVNGNHVERGDWKGVDEPTETRELLANIVARRAKATQ